ncbi:hypothetical protein [Salarchaeum sp. JOR-1]|uniref:hypothetical protein n=1 Tax=Salarchaeum sp. JOR-1 TaxID=2599399 RepID=UPI001198BE6D|nr:hypothetical protein [Salarchaeum sp. JOR-1]QDX41222.1 hypothetical protein FQU85_10065 [Salarchaeum sp. JOR-1]
MSTTQSADVRDTIASCRPTNATPVTIDAKSLDSLSTAHLRDVKDGLRAEDYTADVLELSACFDEDCSFATQDEIDRVRDHIDAAAYLGADTLTVSFDGVAETSKVEPALAASAERARREGVTLELDGPLSLS